MAFDGVFAFQGKDHITASQLGRIVEGVAGKGRYVLPTLNQMTAEMQTANKVRVGTGDLVMDGRVVTNEAAVDLTVESGTSGYKRNDLVVCRYTKNASTGVETFAAEVVKGTPTTGTAADPEVTEGDISTGSASAVMPLWRIPLDGITPGAPVRIAPVASTLKTLGDSVSRVWPIGSVMVLDKSTSPGAMGIPGTWAAAPVMLSPVKAPSRFLNIDSSSGFTNGSRAQIWDDPTEASQYYLRVNQGGSVRELTAWIRVA